MDSDEDFRFLFLLRFLLAIEEIIWSGTAIGRTWASISMLSAHCPSEDFLDVTQPQTRKYSFIYPAINGNVWSHIPWFEVIIYDSMCQFKFINPIVTQKNTISNFSTNFLHIFPKNNFCNCLHVYQIRHLVCFIYFWLNALGEKKDKNTEFKSEPNNNTTDQRCPTLNRALSTALDIQLYTGSLAVDRSNSYLLILSSKKLVAKEEIFLNNY